MAASLGDHVKSSFDRTPLASLIITASSAEVKYVDLRGLLRPTLTLYMQAVGASVTPALSIANVKDFGKDYSTWPWHSFTAIAPNELKAFSPEVGFFLRATFSAQGQLIITSL